VALVREPAAFRPALDAALALDSRALVEDVVVGREIDIAVLRRADGSLLTSPTLEIVVDGLFDYRTKYGGRADFRIPAALEGREAKALEDAAVAVYTALACSGVARVDFFLTDDGPVLNEVNTMPGMTEHSQVPRMFAAAGIPYADLIDELVRGAHR
jgi:D-alanine-D-alanine ligase